jgi:hypothetical protein
VWRHCRDYRVRWVMNWKGLRRKPSWPDRGAISKFAWRAWGQPRKSSGWLVSWLRLETISSRIQVSIALRQEHPVLFSGVLIDTGRVLKFSLCSWVTRGRRYILTSTVHHFESFVVADWSGSVLYEYVIQIGLYSSAVLASCFAYSSLEIITTQILHFQTLN